MQISSAIHAHHDFQISKTYFRPLGVPNFCSLQEKVNEIVQLDADIHSSKSILWPRQYNWPACHPWTHCLEINEVMLHFWMSSHNFLWIFLNCTLFTWISLSKFHAIDIDARLIANNTDCAAEIVIKHIRDTNTGN